jgi:hypothetical protein
VAATRPQSTDYLFFFPQGKEEIGRQSMTNAKVIAYNSLTPIYARLTALNTPASQNFMNESTEGSP